MNTAARDRALLPTVKNVLGRTPVNKLKLTKETNGGLKVLLHTSRPNNVRMETQALAQALQERIGGDRAVTIEVVPEARAVAKFVRASPRKARFVIEVIKGKRVSEAIAMLRFIPNHAAELISKVLISAAANAQDGWGAGVEELKVVNILADGGPYIQARQATGSRPGLPYPQADQSFDGHPVGGPGPRQTTKDRGGSGQAEVHSRARCAEARERCFRTCRAIDDRASTN